MSFKSSLCVLSTSSFLRMCNVYYEYFFPVFGLPVHFFNMYFDQQILLNFDELVYLFFFFFNGLCFL